MTTYRYLDFETTVSMVKVLAEKILKSEKQIDYIIGISRGGLVPAVMLSHYLQKPMVSLEYSTRDNMVMNNGIKWLSQVDNAVVVDDIADSGATLNKVKEINNELITAVLIHKTHTSEHQPDFWVERTDEDHWIDFCWELKNTG